MNQDLESGPLTPLDEDEPAPPAISVVEPEVLKAAVYGISYESQPPQLQIRKLSEAEHSSKALDDDSNTK